MVAGNPNKGEVPLQIGGTLYTLKLSTNAICIAERLSGLTARELSSGLQEASFNAIRSLFAASVSNEHPTMTLEGAGDLMDEAGFAKATKALLEAFTLAFPKAEEGEVSGNATNPQMPEQVGIG